MRPNVENLDRKKLSPSAFSWPGEEAGEVEEEAVLEFSVSGEFCRGPAFEPLNH